MIKRNATLPLGWCEWVLLSVMVACMVTLAAIAVGLTVYGLFFARF